MLDLLDYNREKLFSRRVEESSQITRHQLHRGHLYDISHSEPNDILFKY